ncbi:sugar kinase [Vibrio sp. ZSDZ34]|uniref:2-dehydro-3-deoxygluconokinase n=1 Tax=Vibrio gelatinilyticus TaxID=2893468 RepID=A0A9X1WEC9_9VIBR|nr:sugar kinase [Vibrio gelatinilyticus]MCJ2377663.1 sugar kinase [Vibrio gelatinilyticus]
MIEKTKIAIIGECMVELRRSNGILNQSYGGDTLNTAVYLSRLTHEHNIEVAYVTGLGQDPFSKEMIEGWRQENINTDLVHIDDTKMPGLYSIETAEDGERSFFYWRNDSAAKYWLRHLTMKELIAQLSDHQWIYLSGISLAILPQDCLDKLIEALYVVRKKGCFIAFDNNYRPALWATTALAQTTYRRILEITDLAFLTFDDEMVLWGDTKEQQAIERAQGLGVNEIVVKRGAEPCFVVSNNEVDAVAANHVERVVDTTAAGDSFSAGYLAKRLLNGDNIAAAEAGHTVAGTVIQYSGAIIDNDVMPSI